MSEIDERVQQIAREVFGDEQLALTDSTTARDVPGWDSLGHVNFMYTVEQEFGVRFSDDEFTGLGDVGALKQTLREKLDG